MGFFSDLLDLGSSAVSDIGEMGGNIVGGTLEGLGSALRDPTFVTGALAMAGLAYAGPGLFADSAGNLFTSQQAAGMAGVTPADLAWMDTASPSQLAAAGTNALAPTAAGAGAAGAGAAGAGVSQYLVPGAIVGSALLGANAAQSAAQTQANAQQQANELMYKIYQEQKAQQAPFREAGLTAQNRMLDLLGLSANTGAAGYGSLNKPFGMEQFQADPGYAFRLSEGVKALERSRAAAGGLLGGATGKALTRYGQDLASQEYGNAFSRYQTERANQLNPLAALTAAGQGATNVLGQAAGTYGQQAGAGITNVGAAQAAGNVGTANAITNALGQYLGYSQNQNLADAILQRRSQYIQ